MYQNNDNCVCLRFTSTIAESLVKSGKVTNNVGRPRKRKATDTLSPTSRKQPAAVPCEDVRYDNEGHWPEFRKKKKNKCRLCKVHCSGVYCKKCNLCLFEQYSKLFLCLVKHFMTCQNKRFKNLNILILLY